MRYKLLTILLLAAWVACVFLLVSGSPILVRSLIGHSFPVGNLITWIGLVVLPLAFLTAIPGLRKPASPSDIFFRRFLLLILTAAGLWGIFAFLLSGNWSYTFGTGTEGFTGSAEAARIFWKITYGTFAAECFFILIYLVSGWGRRFTHLMDKK